MLILGVGESFEEVFNQIELVEVFSERVVCTVFLSFKEELLLLVQLRQQTFA